METEIARILIELFAGFLIIFGARKYIVLLQIIKALIEAIEAFGESHPRQEKPLKQKVMDKASGAFVDEQLHALVKDITEKKHGE